MISECGEVKKKRIKGMETEWRNATAQGAAMSSLAQSPSQDKPRASACSNEKPEEINGVLRKDHCSLGRSPSLSLAYGN